MQEECDVCSWHMGGGFIDVSDVPGHHFDVVCPPCYSRGRIDNMEHADIHRSGIANLILREIRRLGEAASNEL